MQIKPLTEIIISPDRIRKTFEAKDLQELINSIKSIGLLHPIVLDETGERLIAGERRLRAISLLAEEGYIYSHNNEDVAIGFIPYTLIQDLPEEKKLQAELEENQARANLTPLERANAITRLYKLRQIEAGEKGEKAPSKKEVAQEVATIEKRNIETASSFDITRSILLAGHGDDPEVQQAKTEKEAELIVRKKLEKQFRETLGLKYTRAQDNNTDHFTKEDKYKAQLICGDSFKVFPTLPGNYFHGIIADPPYGVKANTFDEAARSNSHNYEDTQEVALDCYRILAEQGFRVGRENCFCYSFLDIKYFLDIKQMFETCGWWVWPTPLIWNKNNGATPLKDRGFSKHYESLLYATKGKVIMRKLHGDVFNFSTPSDKLHMAEKPEDLLIELLSLPTFNGDNVLDPFAGSGSSLVAGRRMGLNMYGIEIDESMCQKVIEERSVNIRRVSKFFLETFDEE